MTTFKLFVFPCFSNKILVILNCCYKLLQGIDTKDITVELLKDNYIIQCYKMLQLLYGILIIITIDNCNMPEHFFCFRKCIFFKQYQGLLPH